MLEVDDNTTRAGGEGDKVPLLHLQRFIPLVNRWDLGRLFFRSIPFFFPQRRALIQNTQLPTKNTVCC